MGPNLNEVSRRLVRIESHPSYNSLTSDNDICLLKLSAPGTFTDYIQPVCLASANSTFNTGLGSWVTGFVATQTDLSSDILQEVNVPIVGNNECMCSYGHLTNDLCWGHSWREGCMSGRLRRATADQKGFNVDPKWNCEFCKHNHHNNPHNNPFHHYNNPYYHYNNPYYHHSNHNHHNNPHNIPYYHHNNPYYHHSNPHPYYHHNPC
ncbi:chymotrypsinogen B-like [Perca flavescens]|uniref:chymotrypsinogen B-like n=1 Tax=Perca flavescens TaxID=8167 RepID=UPI00106EDDE7|nr:chymotrypsinogen B-like [Perca flavescens]